MMEWNVLDEEPLPDPPSEVEPSPSPSRIRMLALLASLLVLLLLGLWWLWRTAQLNDARLQEELRQSVLAEERALHFGVVEQADDFADPAAPPAWQACYEAAFQQTIDESPVPRIASIQRENEYAQVTLHYEVGGDQWEMERAYRLVDGQWRRTPVDPSAEDLERRTAYFQLPYGGDVVDLSLDLEALRERIAEQWSDPSCSDCTRTLILLPRLFAPPVYAVDTHSLCLNHPDLFIPDADSSLSPSQQYQLALVTAVVRSLTMPDWLSAYPTAEVYASLSEPRREWLDMLLLFQEAEARLWLLDDGQRRNIRNGWRAELDATWYPPFDGPFRVSPHATDPETRRRWLMVNMLIEWRIAVIGDGAPIASLTHILHNYPPDTFDAAGFFSALVGGSPSDLEILARRYVLESDR